MLHACLAHCLLNLFLSGVGIAVSELHASAGFNFRQHFLKCDGGIHQGSPRFSGGANGAVRRPTRSARRGKRLQDGRRSVSLRRDGDLRGCDERWMAVGCQSLGRERLRLISS
jgi:hypothetical protein